MRPNPTGKYSIVFTPKEGYRDMEIKIPCGNCIGCRLERSRQWAVRCLHEAQMHDANSFITLTFNPENLPEYGSLQKDIFTRFMKRFRRKLETYHAFCTLDQKPIKKTRKKVKGHQPYKIRYFHGAEYGDELMRPHHHVIIFGFDFPDKEEWKINGRKGIKLYRSKLLEELWVNPETNESLGYSSIGEATFDSMAYVARYCTKKINGKEADDHYNTGELITDSDGNESCVYLQPEYATFSKFPPLGKEYYDKYKEDMWATDSVTVNGFQVLPPKYYFKVLEKENPELAKEIKKKRNEQMKNSEIEKFEFELDKTIRLRAKEYHKMLTTKTLYRHLDNETPGVYKSITVEG